MLGRETPDASVDIGRVLTPAVLDALDGTVVTGNWECTVTASTVPNPFSHAPFRVSPEGARPVAGLFNVVSLANNHVYDFLDSGVADTLQHLTEWGVATVGVGTSTSEAYRCWVAEHGGLSVGVLAGTTVANKPPGTSEYCVAECGRPLDEALRAARAEHELVAVHVHAGGGDVAHPSPATRALHEHLREMGAQVIIGHHPHVPQGWLCTNSSADFFSLGDFVFDRRTDGRDIALIAHVLWEAGAISCECLPVRRSEDLVVDRADTDEWILSDLVALNAAIADGTSDEAYLASMGDTYPTVLLESLRRDLRAGGIRAVAQRMARLDRRKIHGALRVLSRRIRNRERGGGA